MAKWNENDDLVRGDEFNLYLIEITSKDGSYEPASATVLAYATSCSLQTDSETIDTSSKFSCKWASNMGGKASYTISADALYTDVSGATSFETLLKYMVSGKQVGWVMGKELDEPGVACADKSHALDPDQTYYNGLGVIQSVSLEAGNNEIASCSLTLNGAGEILIKNAPIE